MFLQDLHHSTNPLPMTIFDSARQLLRQGDTAQALRLLIDHLEKERNNPEALRTLEVIEANFNTTRQKESKGLLDFSEAQQAYNKANDAILGVLEDLSAGRKPRLRPESADRQSTRVYWLIGGGILLLLGLIAGILLRNNNTVTAPEKPVKAASECPAFDTSRITVMLIPFLNQGNIDSKPELAIQTLIRDLTQRNNVKSEVEIFRGDDFTASPPDNEDAMAIGNRCGAKMVIWGIYEKVDNGISLDVRYVFTNAPNLPGGAIADTFKNLTELRNDSTKFSSLEDAVFSLCTFMALHEGNMELAKKWLEKVKEPSARALKIKETLKAI